MKNWKQFFAIASVAAMAVTANAQTQSLGISIGGTYGYLLPQDDAMKSAFGSSIARIGFTPVSQGQRQKGIFPDIEVISASANGNRMFLLPITYGYQQNLSEEGVFRPYFRIFGGLAYMDYDVTIAGANNTGRKFITTYGVELGATLTDKIRISARYNGFAKTDGLNFNNIELTATYTLFKL